MDNPFSSNIAQLRPQLKLAHKLKTAVSFELLDIDLKCKRLIWLELSFPLNCPTLTLQECFLYRNIFTKLSLS